MRLLLLVVVLLGFKTLFPFLLYVTGEGFELCGKMVVWYFVVWLLYLIAGLGHTIWFPGPVCDCYYSF